MTLTIVIDAFAENSTRTLDHLKESVSDIHQQSLRKFPSFIQDKEHIERFEGMLNEAMSSLHVCEILLCLICSLTLKSRFLFGMRNTSKVCPSIQFCILHCILFFTAHSAKTAEQVKTTEANQEGKLIS